MKNFKQLIMRTLAAIILCWAYAHTLVAQDWSGWIPCDDNVCIGPLQYKYRFIDRKAQYPSANISADEAYELNVRFKNTFSEQIHFDYSGRNGIKCPSGRISLKPGEEGGNWTLVASQVAPRISISHVVFGDNGFSGEYCECNPVSHQYENKQSRLSGVMLQQNNTTPSSSYNAGYSSNAYTQPNVFDNTYYEQVRREAQNQQKEKEARERSDAIRQAQEYQRKAEQAQQQAVEGVVNTLGMVAQGIANNRRLREEAEARRKAQEEEDRREAERERREEQRAAAEAARIEALKLAYPGYLDQLCTPNKNYDNIYTPRFFYFVLDRGVLKVSFSNIFAVNPTAYHSLPFIVDIKSNYRLKYGATNAQLMGPFADPDDAVQHKKSLIEKTFQHYWEVLEEHAFQFDQPQSSAAQNTGAQSFWGATKDQKNDAKTAGDSNAFWGVSKIETPKRPPPPETPAPEARADASFWGASKSEKQMPAAAPGAPPKVVQDSAPSAQTTAAPVKPPTSEPAKSVQPQPTTAPPSGSKTPKPELFRLTDKTSLRETASSAAVVLLRFTAGDQVKVIEKTNQWWWRVEFAGQTGYVKAQLLEKN